MTTQDLLFFLREYAPPVWQNQRRLDCDRPVGETEASLKHYLVACSVELEGAWEDAIFFEELALLHRESYADQGSESTAPHLRECEAELLAAEIITQAWDELLSGSAGEEEALYNSLPMDLPLVSVGDPANREIKRKAKLVMRIESFVADYHGVWTLLSRLAEA